VSSTEITGRNTHTGTRTTVRSHDGVITEVCPAEATPADPSCADTDRWLSPGLVDLQVNGFAGFDANATDGDPQTVVAMVHSLFAVGVTTVVPTVVTAAEDHIVGCLRRIAEARALDPLVRRAIPYIHVEGPHLSEQDGARGVHPLEWIRPPDRAEFDRWQQAADGLVGMVTLSPHWDGSAAYVAELAARDVHVAIGHTHATPDQVRTAAAAGARLCTHLGNGAHGTLPRHPNYLWAQLAEDLLSAGFIADGHHLPADTLTAMLRAKGLSRSFLVSDATTLAGAAPGIYQTPVGGEVELSADGRLSQRGTPNLAGAARSVADGVATVANLGPFTLGESVDLATVSPGRFTGGRGRLTVGAPADVVTFDWAPGKDTLTVGQVLVGGTLVVG
jgi:N-acetylglucosamine-6-phosphate deacetylase